MAIALVICFVFGVASATLASNVPSVHRRGAVLPVSSFFLLAAALTTLGPASFFTALLLSTSMGAINATYTRRGGVSVGLTYMTGALVKMGQHLAGVDGRYLRAGQPRTYLPPELERLAASPALVTSMHHEVDPDAEDHQEGEHAEHAGVTQMRDEQAQGNGAEPDADIEHQEER